MALRESLAVTVAGQRHARQRQRGSSQDWQECFGVHARLNADSG
jgi:hypothetical protein